jgi:outer membrane biosynthesis protein TonB
VDEDEFLPEMPSASDETEEQDFESDDEFLAFEAGAPLEEEYDDWGEGMPRSRTPAIVAVVSTAVILLAIIAYVLWQPGTPTRTEDPQLGSVLTTDEQPADEPAPAEEPGEPTPDEAPEPEAPEPDPEAEGSEASEPTATSEPAETSAPSEAPPAEPTPTVAPAPEPVVASTLPAPTTTTPPPPTTTPAPTPEPTAPPSATPAQLVDEGWGKVDRGDLNGAALAFQSALELAPRDAVANFGYGYVLANQGLPQEAGPFLCRALQEAGADVETERETLAVLTEHGLSCE